MSDPRPNLVDFAGAQTTDVQIDATGRDRYEGVAFGQVKDLLTELADKEPQRQGLMLNAVEQGYKRAADAVESAETRTTAALGQVVVTLQQIAGTLGRLTVFMQWLAALMFCGAIFTAFLLAVGGWALLQIVGPLLLVAGL